MCKLTNKAKGRYCEGYKVVAVKDGEFYSTFTNQKYVEGERLPRIERVQCNLGFRGPLLTYWGVLEPGCSFFENGMVGRTAIIKNYFAAVTFWRQLLRWHIEDKSFSVELWKARVYDDIWLGYYGCGEVVAGRKIKFIEKA